MRSASRTRQGVAQIVEILCRDRTRGIAVVAGVLLRYDVQVTTASGAAWLRFIRRGAPPAWQRSPGAHDDGRITAVGASLACPGNASAAGKVAPRALRPALVAHPNPRSCIVIARHLAAARTPPNSRRSGAARSTRCSQPGLPAGNQSCLHSMSRRAAAPRAHGGRHRGARAGGCSQPPPCAARPDRRGARAEPALPRPGCGPGAGPCGFIDRCQPDDPVEPGQDDLAASWPTQGVEIRPRCPATRRPTSIGSRQRRIRGQHRGLQHSTPWATRGGRRLVANLGLQPAGAGAAAAAGRAGADTARAGGAHSGIRFNHHFVLATCRSSASAAPSSAGPLRVVHEAAAQRPPGRHLDAL